MSWKWPCTVRGWVELFAVTGGIVAATLAGGWKLHHANAWADDLDMAEQRITNGLEAFVEEQESKRCRTWLSEISFLEIRHASGESTQAQRDRLIWIRNQYEAECRPGDRS